MAKQSQSMDTMIVQEGIDYTPQGLKNHLKIELMVVSLFEGSK